MTFAPIRPNHLTHAAKEDLITFFQLLQLANLEYSLGFGLIRNLRPSGSNTRMEIGFFMIDVSRLVQSFANRFLYLCLAVSRVGCFSGEQPRIHTIPGTRSDKAISLLLSSSERLLGRARLRDFGKRRCCDAEQWNVPSGVYYLRLGMFLSTLAQTVGDPHLRNSR
jgi:hypothetical protein